MTAVLNKQADALGVYRKAKVEVDEAWQEWIHAGHGFRADARARHCAALDREDQAFEQLVSAWVPVPA